MGIVYVLTNPVMPGLVKIGNTKEAETIEQRLRDLDKTGVPVPFECIAAWEFENYDIVEKALHRAFDAHRVRKSREFFRISPDSVIVLLETFGEKDVTPGDDIVAVDEKNAEDDRASLKAARSRREKFRFRMAGIETGATLTSIWDNEVTCTVEDGDRVSLNGETLSLSAAAVLVINDKGKTWKSASGPDSWKYNGKTLTELRDELYL